MNKLALNLTNKTGHGLFAYSLLFAFATFGAFAVIPGAPSSISTIFSRIGSVIIDAFFFLFFNA
jgi:hypothetical protein